MNPGLAHAACALALFRRRWTKHGKKAYSIRYKYVECARIHIAEARRNGFSGSIRGAFLSAQQEAAK